MGEWDSAQGYPPYCSIMPSGLVQGLPSKVGEAIGTKMLAVWFPFSDIQVSVTESVTSGSHTPHTQCNQVQHSQSPNLRSQ
jgi:hypothetical protein